MLLFLAMYAVTIENAPGDIYGLNAFILRRVLNMCSHSSYGITVYVAMCLSRATLNLEGIIFSSAPWYSIMLSFGYVYGELERTVAALDILISFVMPKATSRSMRYLQLQLLLACGTLSL